MAYVEDQSVNVDLRFLRSECRVRGHIRSQEDHREDEEEGSEQLSWDPEEKHGLYLAVS